MDFAFKCVYLKRGWRELFAEFSYAHLRNRVNGLLVEKSYCKALYA